MNNNLDNQMNVIPNMNQNKNQMMNLNMMNKNSHDQEFYAFMQQSNMQNIEQSGGIHFTNVIPK